MPPSSRPCRALFLAWLAFLAGCASSGGLGDGGDPDKIRRRPDGVAIDPVSAPPPAQGRAEAADGLVTLRTPLGVDRAMLTVGDLFRKIVLEDAEGLERLFVGDAMAIIATAPGGGPGQTQKAMPWWAARFRKLDYTKLAGEIVYRESELTIFRAEDTLESPPHQAIRTEALDENDVVIRVPILTARVGADRLFGDEMILWLRRDGERFRIYRMLEEFQLN
jgi:hypothetical protein